MNLQVRNSMYPLRLLSLVVAGLFLFTSCEDAPGPVMSADPGAPAITSPGSEESFTLSEEAAGDTLFTFSWESPDYGVPTAVTYQIQMDPAAGDFAEPVTIGDTTATTYPVTVENMNNRLLSAGLPFGEESTVAVRVVASVTDSLDRQVSEPVTLSFTPYEVVITYPEVYVPGGYQAPSGYGTNWEPADAPPLYSFESNDVYEGYVYIATAGSPFKFTGARNWEEGDYGAGETAGTLAEPGANIVAEQPGYYYMNVDLNAMTYDTTVTEWGIIGDATAGAWDTDQDMTYDPEAQVWTITADLSAGALKFLANDAWDINYGDDNADGNLEFNGGNIMVEEAGTYEIILNLSTAPYSYQLNLQ